jgi:hypothetical protein
MRARTDPRVLVDQMMMAQRVLEAIDCGAMPAHPAGYQEVARCASESVRSMDAPTRRGLRDAAPCALQELIENVLHERDVISWAGAAATLLGARAQCAALLWRCGVWTARGWPP